MEAGGSARRDIRGHVVGSFFVTHSIPGRRVICSHATRVFLISRHDYVTRSGYGVSFTASSLPF